MRLQLIIGLMLLLPRFVFAEVPSQTDLDVVEAMLARYTIALENEDSEWIIDRTPPRAARQNAIQWKLEENAARQKSIDLVDKQFSTVDFAEITYSLANFELTEDDDIRWGLVDFSYKMILGDGTELPVQAVLLVMSEDEEWYFEYTDLVDNSKFLTAYPQFEGVKLPQSVWGNDDK